MKLLIIFTVLLQVNLLSEDKAEEFVRSWVKTFNMNNPEKQLEFYSKAVDTDLLVSSGYWHKGIKEIQNAYETDKKNLIYSDSQLKNLKIKKVGIVYLVSFEHLFKLQLKENNVKLQLHIRTTMVIEELDGKLEIVQEHSSSIKGIDRVTLISE